MNLAAAKIWLKSGKNPKINVFLEKTIQENTFNTFFLPLHYILCSRSYSRLRIQLLPGQYHQA